MTILDDLRRSPPWPGNTPEPIPEPVLCCGPYCSRQCPHYHGLSTEGQKGHCEHPKSPFRNEVMRPGRDVCRVWAVGVWKKGKKTKEAKK
jgi:hypothetical protein